MEKNKKYIERYDEMLNEIKVSDLLKYISDKVIFTRQYDYNWITEYTTSSKFTKCYFKYDRIKDSIRSSETKRKLIYHQDMTIGEMLPCLSYISRNVKRWIVSNDSLLKYICFKRVHNIFIQNIRLKCTSYFGIETENFCSNDKIEELKKVKDKLYSIRTEMQRLVEIENKYKHIERGIENHIEIHNSIYSKSLNLY